MGQGIKMTQIKPTKTARVRVLAVLLVYKIAMQQLKQMSGIAL